MYARFVSGCVASEKIDEAIQLWEAVVLPSARQQRGFKSVRLLVDRRQGKIASMALWETEADFTATISWNASQVAQFTSLFLSPPNIEGFEVVEEFILL